MAAVQRNSRNRLTPFSAAWSISLLILAFSAAVGEDSPRYLQLEEALARYERIADAGGWPITPDGPTMEPGSDDPRIASVARRLVASGDLPSAAGDVASYDEELQAAVLRFQARHGLEQDALIGKQTLGALNVPAARRVEQIRLNMERTRQVFAAEREDFLLVNIPAFTVTLFRDGEPLTRTRVIVGEIEMQTPLFEADLKSVVLNPTWTVPRKIASEELLPKIQADIGYLARNGYDVVDRDGARVDPSNIDWASLGRNNFPYTLIQRPGPGNELGRIKFLFPNEYGVCMHDTPNKGLFTRDSRAFSHGCVRMEDPVSFAGHLLGPEGWSREQIAAQLETTRTHTIALAEPLPVVLVYLTAEVDDSGTMYFYRDIYGRDAG
jgi:murein L,D-transpeptidase YcbB/YkuD